MRLTSFACAGIIMMIATEASATTPRIEWEVRNNFRLHHETSSFEPDYKDYMTKCMEVADGYDPRRCHVPRAQPSLSMPANVYRTRFAPKTLTYPRLLRPNDSNLESFPDSVGIRLQLADSNVKGDCEWRVGSLTKTSDCEGLDVAVKIERVTKVSVRQPGGAAPFAETTVKVERRIIAAIGDSLMSGEGNPHVLGIGSSSDEPHNRRSSQWLEGRCHRSLLSASARAAADFAVANPQIYVVYFNAACSGAKVHTGVLGSYAGVESVGVLKDRLGAADGDGLFYEGTKGVAGDPTALPSQLEELGRALCVGGCLPADTVFLSVGLNDLTIGSEDTGFSSIVMRLASANCRAACREEIKAIVTRKLSWLRGDTKLPANRFTLQTAYERALKRFDAKKLVVVPYVNPLQTDSGDFCSGSILASEIQGIYEMTVAASRFAYEEILKPLNDTIEAAVKATVAKLPAEEKGRIIYLASAASVTDKHGFCAAKSYFNVVIDAMAAGNLSGAMHPNAVGHKYLGRALLPMIEH